MKKQKKKKTAAVIDIGSNFVKMVVAQKKGGAVQTLDTLLQPLPLGHDVFNTGTIGFECITALCEILTGYQAVLPEYGVEECTVIATSAMREAANRDFVLDQIRVKTGVSVRICDDSREKSMIYFEVIRALSGRKDSGVSGGKTLISHIGTGSIGLCIRENDVISYAQNITMGALKIHDMLGDITSSSAFYNAAEEYLDVVFGNLILPCPGTEIDNLILTGTEVDLMAKLCQVKEDGGTYRIGGESIRTLFRQVKKTSLEQLSWKYQISEERAEIFYSTLSIFCRLMEMTRADHILVPKIELADAFLQKMLSPDWRPSYASYIEKSALACAETYARRYRCGEAHYRCVCGYAAQIFDRLKRRHGFSDLHRTMVQVAAILHDCGYYVNSKSGCSGDVIFNMDICGLSADEMKLVAAIANFNETNEPDYQSLHFLSLGPEQLLLCAKLTAVFRLANALDKSKKQKLGRVAVALRKDELHLTASCDQDLHLEQWAFRRCSPFFKEAFGIQPVLQIKSTMLG